MDTREQHGDNELEALSSAVRAGMLVLRYVMAAALAAWLVRSMIFVVRQHEVGFALRFGRLVGTGSGRILEPGLHVAWPYPVDEIVLVPVLRVRTVVSDSFWPDPSGVKLGGYALTGDANALQSKWACRYVIRDPAWFAFGVRDLDRIVACELDRAVLEASAAHRVDEALRAGAGFRDAVGAVLARRCERLALGIAIERVDLLEFAPPAQAKSEFDAVLQAEMEHSRNVNLAMAYAARAGNEALGEASRLLARAEARRSETVSATQADAEYFERILPGCLAAPLTFRQALLQDTLRRALARIGDKCIVRRLNGDRQELRLMIAPEPGRFAKPSQSGVERGQ